MTDYILGLDVSTAITGGALLYPDGSIRHLFSCDLKKYDTMWEKANHIQEVLRAINDIYHPDKIFIESALMAFKQGQSSALTLSTLLKFNGIVSWLCYAIFDGKHPQYIPAISARSKCGIKVPKGQKAKIVTFNHWLKNEPDFASTISYTHKGNPKPHHYDISDALTIAKAGILTLTQT